MIITWFGESCFKIQDNKGADKVVVASDPFDDSIGLKVPNFEANVLTISHQHRDHANVKAISGHPYIIDVAGEYDIHGVMVQGIDSFHDEHQGADRGKNIIYRIEIGGISIAHLGDLGHILKSEQLAQLEKIDILMVPVGGKYTLDAKQATEVVAQIEPRIVIPMHYKIDGLNLDIDNVDAFVKNMALAPSYEDELKITAKDLPQEDTELVILKPFLI